MLRSEYLNDLRNEVRTIRSDVQKHFYFLEGEDLLRRPAKGKWNILEIFAHINIFQAYYIKQIKKVLDVAPETHRDEYHSTWFGRKFRDAMKPKEGGTIRFKMRTFKTADPLRLAKKGVKFNERVVFQDFVEELEELEELMRLSYDRDISAVKIPAYFPFLKLNVADAFAVILAHTERHVQQAKNALKG